MALFDIQRVEVGTRKLTARIRLANDAPVMTNEDLEGTSRVYYLVPGVVNHMCLGDSSEVFRDVMGATEIAHLLEHVTVELLALTNIAGDISSGRTFAVQDTPRTWDIEFSCPDDVLVAAALSSAVWMLEWAYSGGEGPEPDVDGIVDGLIGLVDSLPEPAPQQIEEGAVLVDQIGPAPYGAEVVVQDSEAQDSPDDADAETDFEPTYDEELDYDEGSEEELDAESIDKLGDKSESEPELGSDSELEPESIPAPESGSESELKSESAHELDSESKLDSDEASAGDLELNPKDDSTPGEDSELEEDYLPEDNPESDLSSTDTDEENEDEAPEAEPTSEQDEDDELDDDDDDFELVYEDVEIGFDDEEPSDPSPYIPEPRMIR